MKQILVFSDSHYHNAHFLQIINHYPTIHTVIHAGDIQQDIPALQGYDFKIVRGNNDFCNLPEELFFTYEKVRVMLCHGHQYLVDLGPNEIARKAKANRCQLVIHGHTHMPYFQKIEGVYVLNPGSVSFPRSPDHPYPTFALLTIDQDQVSAQFYHARDFREIKLTTEKEKKKKNFFSFFKRKH